MMARNERAYNLAQDWILWMDRVKFFCKPEQQNILAQFMASKPRRGEPDGELSATIHAFNLAVTDLPVADFVPFIVVYCKYRPRPIKVMAHEFGIDTSTFYDRAHASAFKVLHDTDKLVRLNAMIRCEGVGFSPYKIAP